MRSGSVCAACECADTVRRGVVCLPPSTATHTTTGARITAAPACVVDLTLDEAGDMGDGDMGDGDMGDGDMGDGAWGDGGEDESDAESPGWDDEDDEDDGCAEAAAAASESDALGASVAASATANATATATATATGVRERESLVQAWTQQIQPFLLGLSLTPSIVREAVVRSLTHCIRCKDANTRYASIAAELNYLCSSRGVTSVTARKLRLCFGVSETEMTRLRVSTLTRAPVPR
jgi:hypothetical protein